MDTNPFTTGVLTQPLSTHVRTHRRAALTLLCVAAAVLTLTAAGLFARYVRQQLRAAPIVIIATATAARAPAAAVKPTAVAIVMLIGYWDYRDATTAAPVDSTRLSCVVGTAADEQWLLVTLDTCDVAAPRVWLPAELVPPRVPRASSADLTPPTAAPALASDQPSYGVSSAPVEQEVATDEPPIYNLSAARELPTTEIAVPLQPTPDPAWGHGQPAGEWGGGGGSGWSQDGDQVCYGEPRTCYPVAP